MSPCRSAPAVGSADAVLVGADARMWPDEMVSLGVPADVTALFDEGLNDGPW